MILERVLFFFKLNNFFFFLFIGGFIAMKGRPAKIVETSVSKTGKHGHAKMNIVAIGLDLLFFHLLYVCIYYLFFYLFFFRLFFYLFFYFFSCLFFFC
jgi:hypothetical protein